MGASAIGLSVTTLVLLIALALAFDFMNGFHDAANSIATVVSTGVLKPHQAVLWAAACNVAAILVFHLKVAATVGKGIVDPVDDFRETNPPSNPELLEALADASGSPQPA